MWGWGRGFVQMGCCGGGVGVLFRWGVVVSVTPIQEVNYNVFKNILKRESRLCKGFSGPA